MFCKRSKSNTNKMFCLDLDCNFNFLLNAVHIIVAIHIRLIHIRNTKKECGRTNRCLVLFFPVSVIADNCWQYWRLTLPITPKHRYWLGWPNFVKAAFLLTQKKLFCIFMTPSNDIYICVDIDKLNRIVYNRKIFEIYPRRMCYTTNNSLMSSRHV